MPDNTAILRDYYNLPLAERNKIDISKFEILNDFNSLPDSEKQKVSKSLGFSIDVGQPLNYSGAATETPQYKNQSNIANVDVAPTPNGNIDKDIVFMQDRLTKLPLSVKDNPKNRTTFYSVFAKQRGLDFNNVKEQGERRYYEDKLLDIQDKLRQSPNNELLLQDAQKIEEYLGNRDQVQQLLDVRGAQMPQVGDGSYLQPTAGESPTTFGFTPKQGTTIDEQGNVVANTTPTKESEYLKNIGEGIKSYTADILGAPQRMIGEGIDKIGDTKDVYNKEGGLSAALNATTGAVEILMGAMGGTGAGASFILPFETASKTLPESTAKWMSPLSTMVQEYYQKKGEEAPSYITNGVGLTELALLGALIHGGVKMKGNAELKTIKNKMVSGEELTTQEQFKANDAKELSAINKKIIDNNITKEDIDAYAKAYTPYINEVARIKKLAKSEALSDVQVNNLLEGAKEKLVLTEEQKKMFEGITPQEIARFEEAKKLSKGQRNIADQMEFKSELEQAVENITPEQLDGMIKQVEQNNIRLGGDPYLQQAELMDKMGEAKIFLEEQKKQLQETEDAKIAEQKANGVYERTEHPTLLQEVQDGADIEFNNEIGKLERGDDGSWYFVNENGSKHISVKDKFNPSETLIELGIQVLPDVPQEILVKAASDAEMVGDVVVNGKRYFVSLGNKMNELDTTGDLVLEYMPDGSLRNRLDSHQDKKFGRDRKLSIINKFLGEKELPKREELFDGNRKAVEVKTEESKPSAPITNEGQDAPPFEVTSNVSSDGTGVPLKSEEVKIQPTETVDLVEPKIITEETIKANENTTDTQAKTSTDTRTENQGGEVKTLRRGTPKTRRKIKNPNYIKAINIEVTDPYDMVLQYFIRGGEVNKSAAQELFGIKGEPKTKAVIGEEKARFGIMSNPKAPSIQQIAHKLWESLPEMENGEKMFDTQQLRNAVEDVITSHNGRKTMVDDLLQRHEKNLEQTEEQYRRMFGSEYDPTIDYEEALAVAEDLPSDVINEILASLDNGSEGLIDDLVKNYLSETESADTKSTTPSRTAKEINAEIAKINKALESKNAESQTNLLGEGVEQTMFDDTAQLRERKRNLEKERDNLTEAKEPSDISDRQTKIDNIIEVASEDAEYDIAINELKELIAKQKKGKQNLGVVFDNKKIAQEQYDLHQAYLKVAKEAIKKGIKSAGGFMDKIGIYTKGAMMAFEEALNKRITPLTIEDFTKSAKLRRDFVEPIIVKAKKTKDVVNSNINSIKKAPSYKELTTQIGLEVKAAKQGYKQGVKEAKQEKRNLATKINDLLAPFKGKLTNAQSKAVVREALSATSMPRFERFMEKVFADVEYAEKIELAKKLQGKVKKLAKSKTFSEKNGINNSITAKDLSKVDFKEVEDINQYIDIANRFIESNKKLGLNETTNQLRLNEPTINNKEVMDFITDYTTKLDERDLLDLSTEYQDLVQQGVIDPNTMSLKEMSAIIEGINNSGLDPTDPTLQNKINEAVGVDASKKETLRKSILSLASAKLPLLEEYKQDNRGALTTRQQDAIDTLLQAKGENLSLEEAAAYHQAINNIINNNSFANVDAILNTIELKRDIRNFVESNKGAKWGGDAINPLESKDQILKSMFGDDSMASKAKEASGITKLWDDVAKAKNEHDKAIQEVETLKDSIKKTDKNIDNAYNKISRTALSYMRMDRGGDVIDKAADFKRRKDNMLKMIASLKEAGMENKTQPDGKIVKEKSLDYETKNNQAYRKEGEILESVFNKHIKDAKTRQEMINSFNSENANNIRIVDLVRDIYSRYANEVLETAEMTNNKLDLDWQGDYIGTKMRKIGESNRVNEYDENIFEPKVPQTLKAKMASAKERLVEELPEGVALNLNFEKVFSDKLYETLYDVRANKQINKLRQLFNSQDGVDLFGSQANKNIVKSKIIDGIIQQRGDVVPRTVGERQAAKAYQKVRDFAIVQALGGISAVAKQGLSVAVRSMLEKGGSAKYLFQAITNIHNPVLDEFNISMRKGMHGGTKNTTADYNKLVARDQVENKSILEKIDDRRESNVRAMMGALTKTDDAIARASWIMFYLKNLEQQGIKFKTVDDALQLRNREAAGYAEQKVSTSQNVNDPASAPSIYHSKNIGSKIALDILAPYNSFALNAKVSQYIAIKQIANGTKEQKAEGLRTLANIAVEQAVFNAIKVYGINEIRKSIGNAIAEQSNIKKDDEENYASITEESKKIPLGQKWLAATAGDVVFGGLPQFAQTAGRQAVNKVYNTVNELDQKSTEGVMPVFIDENSPETRYMDLLGTLSGSVRGIYNATDNLLSNVVTSDARLRDGDIKTDDEKVSLTPSQKVAALGIMAYDLTSIVGGLSDNDATMIRNQIAKQLEKDKAEKFGTRGKREYESSPKTNDTQYLSDDNKTEKAKKVVALWVAQKDEQARKKLIDDITSSQEAFIPDTDSARIKWNNNELKAAIYNNEDIPQDKKMQTLRQIKNELSKGYIKNKGVGIQQKTDKAKLKARAIAKDYFSVLEASTEDEMKKMAYEMKVKYGIALDGGSKDSTSTKGQVEMQLKEMIKAQNSGVLDMNKFRKLQQLYK